MNQQLPFATKTISQHRATSVGGKREKNQPTPNQLFLVIIFLGGMTPKQESDQHHHLQQPRLGFSNVCAKVSVGDAKTKR